MTGLRRLTFVIGAMALAVGLGGASPVGKDDMTLGDPRAKVTVIEYASLSCPHCAHFNNEIFPAFRKKYIDTGKVRFVYREFLTPPAELAALGALTARCAGPKNYFKVIDVFFRGQAEIYRTSKARDVILRAGKAGGLSEKKINACLADKTAQDALDARVKRWVEEDKIESTPTLVINGKVLEGAHTLQALDAAIQPLLAR